MRNTLRTSLLDFPFLRFNRLSALCWQAASVVFALAFLFTLSSCRQTNGTHPAPEVHDPGVRGGSPGAGDPLPGLTADETEFFQAGLRSFLDIEGVADGLGPRFNSNQCASCHLFPTVGGSSPPKNPLFAVATAEGARNIIPWFIVRNEKI